MLRPLSFTKCKGETPGPPGSGSPPPGATVKFQVGSEQDIRSGSVGSSESSASEMSHKRRPRTSRGWDLASSSGSGSAAETRQPRCNGRRSSGGLQDSMGMGREGLQNGDNDSQGSARSTDSNLLRVLYRTPPGSNKNGDGGPAGDEIETLQNGQVSNSEQQEGGKPGLPISAKDVEGRPFLWVDYEFKTKKKDNLCFFYWLFVAVILLLIAFTIWLSVQLAARHSSLQKQKKQPVKIDENPFTFDDIFNSSLQYRSFSVRWVQGQDKYTYRKEGDLLSYDISTNSTELLVPSETFDSLGATEYSVSADLRYVLLGYDVQTLWRHSFLARYKIYDRVNTSTLIDFPNDGDLRDSRVQHADWAPSGTGLVFISGNDLYYQADPLSTASQATFTGQDKFIFNGLADWLYEEEILATHVANWWSADGSYLCYAVFNDTNVPLFKFPYYGPKEEVYGDTIEIAYPKAGDLEPDRNTKASLYILDTSNVLGQHVQLQPPPSLTNEDHYFIQVSWRDASSVTVVWANRPQNHTITTVCDIGTGACQQNRERTVVGGWVDPTPYVDHIEGGTAYLTIHPRDVLSAGSWNHLTYVTAPAGSEGTITFLTDGEQEVKSISGFDADTNMVYYITTSGDPRSRHLYRVGTPAADPADQVPVCLTCSLAPACQYVSASFSTTGKYYVLGCLGPDIPTYRLRATESAFEQMLEDNADVLALLQEKDLPRKEFMTIPIGGGYNAWAEVFIPPAAEGSSDTFPLLVQTYAGPGSQSVDFRFGTGLETYLASSENVVYARLDGRGTASRGNDFKHLVYRRLGTLEIDDQLLGGSHLADTLSYIDSSRTAIWGWSYGGFATSHAVANETNVYDCGIIGAALSDRRYYDTAHTERFMGRATPDDNQSGYEGTDVMRKVELFRNKTFLIVHGTADDNVHFASSAQLIKVLTDAEIQFRLQIYPDKNHYFSSSSRHLYRLYTDFLLNDCWKIPSPAKVEYIPTVVSEQFSIKTGKKKTA